MAKSIFIQDDARHARMKELMRECGYTQLLKFIEDAVESYSVPLQSSKSGWDTAALCPDCKGDFDTTRSICIGCGCSAPRK